MSITRIAALVAVVVGCLLVSPSCGALYHATLLHRVEFTDGSVADGISGSSQVGYGLLPGIFNAHALLWNGTADSVIDLNTAAFPRSWALDVDGNSQVGSAFNFIPPSGGHAMLWHGTAESAIDLHPAGLSFSQSQATGVSGTTQVGRGGNETCTPCHALLWHGTAESVVDLHAPGFNSTSAEGVSEGSQVGSGYVGSAGAPPSHALLWHGTADSVVDLHPAGYDSSEAWDVLGTSQVGNGTIGDQGHALLWHGTADSVVDLHPAGFDSSVAKGVSGIWQVGDGGGGVIGETTHALVWTGTADSVIDLHPYLAGLGLGPSIDYSTALAVAENGDVVGYAGTGFLSQTYAVLWSRVPEPSTGMLFCCGTIVAALARFPRRPMDVPPRATPRPQHNQQNTENPPC